MSFTVKLENDSSGVSVSVDESVFNQPQCLSDLMVNLHEYLKGDNDVEALLKKAREV